MPVWPEVPEGAAKEREGSPQTVHDQNLFCHPTAPTIAKVSIRPTSKDPKRPQARLDYKIYGGDSGDTKWPSFYHRDPRVPRVSASQAGRPSHCRRTLRWMERTVERKWAEMELPWWVVLWR